MVIYNRSKLFYIKQTDIRPVLLTYFSNRMCLAPAFIQYISEVGGGDILTLAVGRQIWFSEILVFTSLVSLYFFLCVR
jgi:hypothetical protein